MAGDKIVLHEEFERRLSALHLPQIPVEGPLLAREFLARAIKNYHKAIGRLPSALEISNQIDKYHEVYRRILQVRLENVVTARTEEYLRTHVTAGKGLSRKSVMARFRKSLEVEKHLEEKPAKFRERLEELGVPQTPEDLERMLSIVRAERKL